MEPEDQLRQNEHDVNRAIDIPPIHVPQVHIALPRDSPMQSNMSPNNTNNPPHLRKNSTPSNNHARSPVQHLRESSGAPHLIATQPTFSRQQVPSATSSLSALPPPVTSIKPVTHVATSQPPADFENMLTFFAAKDENDMCFFLGIGLPGSFQYSSKMELITWFKMPELVRWKDYTVISEIKINLIELTFNPDESMVFFTWKVYSPQAHQIALVIQKTIDSILADLNAQTVKTTKQKKKMTTPFFSWPKKSSHAGTIADAPLLRLPHVDPTGGVQHHNLTVPTTRSSSSTEHFLKSVCLEHHYNHGSSTTDTTTLSEFSSVQVPTESHAAKKEVKPVKFSHSAPTHNEVSEKEQDDCKSRDEGALDGEDLYGVVPNQSFSPR